MIKRVKARLAELRKEKEANLYPFKPLQGPVENLDSINTESGLIKDIGSEPASDKKNQRINAEPIAQSDLAYKTEGKTTTEKSVSMPGKKSSAEDTRDLKNAVDKAKLSVELAGIQQLKGLIDNPLKEAMVKNMVEVGIDKEAAEAIAHNSFVDGFESNQKVIMKEAFETFMQKPYDDFVKVAKFTKDYIIKEGSVLAPVEGEETREKTASTTPPLRGSISGHDGEEYKGYWQDVQRKQRGF